MALEHGRVNVIIIDAPDARIVTDLTEAAAPAQAS
jgi:hypothetical protein